MAKIPPQKSNNYIWLALSILAIGVVGGGYLAFRMLQPQKAQIAIIGGGATNDQQISKKPLVGVRHFPGYPSANHTVGNAQEQLLASGQFINQPQDWSDRWPYYTIVRSKDTIDIDEDDQRVIDQEIQLTAASGIDYWAIETDWLGTTNTGYDYALNLYNKSAYKNQLKYSLIVTTDELSAPTWKESNYFKSIVSAFKDNQYVRVADNQPLLYMWRFDTLVEKMGAPNAKKRVKEFVDALKQEVGKDPYLVMMDLSSLQSLSDAKDFSADARTSYLGEYKSCGNGGPYRNLMQDNAKQWDSFKSSNLNYVPLVTIGMDPRPKSVDTELFEFGKDPVWCQQGTPFEIANNVKAAVDWVKDNPKVTSGANTVLLAAWMDTTESGWLVPTTKEGNARLNAISHILGGHEMEVPVSPYKNNTPALQIKGDITQLSVKDNTIFAANQPITITGVAPMAARLRVIFQGAGHTQEKFFINGKGTAANRKFTITLPGLPAGGPYTLTIRGISDDPKLNDVRFVRASNITIK